MTQKRRKALIAVSNKARLPEFASRLVRLDFEIISTGGTARALREADVPVTEVQEITGFPELLDGRVKTLHPRLHGGILARRDLETHRAALAEHSIPTIDLVVVNLYPFEERTAAGVTFAEAIEEIDIGGPTLMRAAAKNHAHVGVVVSPDDYGLVLEELEAHGGELRPETRRRLALAAFRRTAAYDAAISNWLGAQEEGDFPAVRTEQWSRLGMLRYGENPHQRAAWYRRTDGGDYSLAMARRQGGKELSYNNLLDGAAAIECVRALSGPAAVIVKHCLPCGAAEADDLAMAFRRAHAGDPVSAFGGIVAFNRPLDRATAGLLATAEHFFEVIHAPRFLDGAIEALHAGARWGKNCRLIEGGEQPATTTLPPLELRSLPGALLLQDADRPQATRDSFRLVGRTPIDEDTWQDLLFAWRVIPFVRSNGILLAHGRQVVGVGAGQPSRVDAVHIASRKAGERAAGAVLASDAFFPFPDGVEAAAIAGVRAVIQPGGSMRDEAVIEAADRAGVAMVFTGERHFKH